MKKVTTEEFKQAVFDMYGDEYTVIDEYGGFLNSINILHNKCGKVYKYSCGGRFLRGISKCPYCNTNQHVCLNTDIFKYRVYQAVGDEYTVIGEYTGANKKIRMRHNKCSCKDGFYEYDVTPHNFLDMGARCLYDSHQQEYTIDDFKNALAENLPTYKCLGTEYVNSRSRIDVLCDKGHIFKMSLDSIRAGCKCGVCSGVIVSIGINDLNTTHPQVAQYLVNKKDGSKYAFNTKTKLLFKCPNCGNIVKKVPVCVLNNKRFVCICNDNVSYPEKFMSNILDRLHIKYTYQLTSRDFKWCGKYRYDFYLDDFIVIIETHGGQHFGQRFLVDPQDIIKNDIEKEKLANANGVKYIAIDMRNSTLDYCKNSIINSDFFSQFDLDKIDWDEADTFACKSLLVQISDDWNDGLCNVKYLAEKYHLATTTIYKYLERANSLHLCSFDKKEYIHQTRKSSYVYSNNVKVKSVETGIVYNSIAEARRLAGAHLTRENIGNPNRISANQHWVYA